MNPRLLLLEDDPVSAAFLGQSLAALPVRVELAVDLAQARRCADDGQALWLFDLRLPDGDGAGLLAELRARGWQVPALALSADVSPPLRRALVAAGFSEVLAKPIGAAELQAAVSRYLVATRVPAAANASGRERGEPVDVREPDALAPAWDDAAALAALGGNPASVQALRQLFLAELPGQCLGLRQARERNDATAMRELLHRLKASCGFVGARALLESVRALYEQPGDADALVRLDAQARRLLGFSPAEGAPAPTASPRT